MFVPPDPRGQAHHHVKPIPTQVPQPLQMLTAEHIRCSARLPELDYEPVVEADKDGLSTRRLEGFTDMLKKAPPEIDPLPLTKQPSELHVANPPFDGADCLPGNPGPERTLRVRVAEALHDGDKERVGDVPEGRVRGIQVVAVPPYPLLIGEHLINPRHEGFGRLPRYGRDHVSLAQGTRSYSFDDQRFPGQSHFRQF